MPSFLASRTSRSRARLSSLASVGNITTFGCTVVSITTRARSDGFIASVRVATARLSCNSALSLSSPIRWRQRVSDDRSNTNACWKNSSPQKYWKYGFSTERSHKASSERSVQQQLDAEGKPVTPTFTVNVGPYPESPPAPEAASGAKDTRH